MTLFPPVETKNLRKKSRTAVPLNRKYTVKKLFPAKESLVSDIPDRNGKTANLFNSDTITNAAYHCQRSK